MRVSFFSLKFSTNPLTAYIAYMAHLPTIKPNLFFQIIVPVLNLRSITLQFIPSTLQVKRDLAWKYTRGKASVNNDISILMDTRFYRCWEFNRRKWIVSYMSLYRRTRIVDIRVKQRGANLSMIYWNSLILSCVYGILISKAHSLFIKENVSKHTRPKYIQVSKMGHSLLDTCIKSEFSFY